MRSSERRRALSLLLLAAGVWLRSVSGGEGDITICEIYYHPPSDCEEEEFIELFHRGSEPADISGWHFLEGVPWEFPAGTVVAPGELVVVARDPEALERAFGPIPNLFGPWGAWPDGDGEQAELSNGGEDIVLADATGTPVARVEYDDEAPWPVSPDGGGPSLERISPFVDYEKAGNFRAAGQLGGGWQAFEASGPVEDDLLQIRLDQAGEYLVDDISLTAESGGPNLVALGGFESDGAWTFSGNHAASGPTEEDAWTGGASLRVVAAGPGGAGNAVEQRIAGLVLGGPLYRLSFRARSLSPESRLTVGFAASGSRFSESEDIGTVQASGSSSYDAGTDSYTVRGSGADIWGTIDEFRFVHGELAGDGVIEGRVRWSGTPSNGWAKAGFMIRETTSPSSRHAMVLLSRDNGVRLQFRTDTGGSSADRVGPSTPGPVRLRLTRRGDSFIAEADTGGGFEEFARVTIPMQPSVRAGLMVTSHDDGAIAAALYDGVASSGTSLQVTTSSRDDAPSLRATPGAENSQFRLETPPYVRRVQHFPLQPVSGEAPRVEAKADNPDGVTPIASVTLEYQVVPPGEYIRLSDPEYSDGWTAVSMRDDGSGGDREAGDRFWTARLPGFSNRTLVRYRVTAVDAAGAVTRVPCSDDPSPNFAFFVYDGVPDYVADVVSRHGPTPYTHAAAGLTRLPVYWLITRAEDLDECWYEAIPFSDKAARKEFRWEGAFVIEGRVFDHIRYRLRGGVWRYTYQKRFMKVRFNRGHPFRAFDNFYRVHPKKRRTLNLNSCISNPSAGNHVRGEDGMFEVLAFYLFGATGLPSSDTAWVHYRIITSPGEDGGDQYSGDFYGIYLDVEQPDGQYLENHGRSSDANLYKIDTGALNGRWDKETNGCDPADDSDIRGFVGTYEGTNPSESWWRANLDLESYYDYRSGIEMTRHYDIGAGKNYYYYHNPETDLWEVFPWDLDLTFNTNFSSVGNEPFLSRVLERFPNTFGKEYRNRLREMADLLFYEEKLFPIIDGWTELIAPVTYADRDRWDTGDFASIHQRVSELKGFLRGRFGALQNFAADPGIPARPQVLSPAPRALVPPGGFELVSSPFSDPQGDAHRSTRCIATRVGRFSSLGSLERRDLVGRGALWRFWRGDAEPPGAPLAWARRGYDDSTWEEGPAGLGYGDGDDATDLADMRGGYTSLYARREFEVSAASAIGALELAIDYDDGFVAMLNGVVVLRVNAPAGDPVSRIATATTGHEAGSAEVFRLGAEALAALEDGTNVLALHGLNVTFDSSDFSLHPALAAILGDPGEASPDVPLLELLGENELFPDWDSGPLSGGISAVELPLDALGGEPGAIYRLRVRYEDATGRRSHWSPPVEVQVTSAIEGGFRRGDANADGVTDVSDAVRILFHLFRGLELSCEAAADIDRDATLGVTDAVRLLDHLYRGGPPPAAPYPGCGVDAAEGALGCEAYPACG